MLLFIDKMIAHSPMRHAYFFFFFMLAVCAAIALHPRKAEQVYIEGVIYSYAETTETHHHFRGGSSKEHVMYMVIYNGDYKKLYIPSGEWDKFKGREKYWRKKLIGKKAKAYYLVSDPQLGEVFREQNRYLHMEVEDGSYSYHDKHELSYYDTGWKPFCVTLLIILPYLRFLCLLIFASDERRELLFGNKDYNPF